MSRVLRLILAGLAGFLLCTAVLLMVYAPGKAKVTPLDINSTTHLSGTATALPTGGRGPIKAVNRSAIDSGSSDGDVAVFESFTCLMTGTSGPECVDDKDPDKRLVSASTDRFATDRKTALAIQDEKYTDVGDKHEGLINKLPFDAEKKTYPMWDGILGKSVDLVFDGEEEIEGLNTYRYIIDIPATKAEIAKGVQGTYQDHKTLWYEPKTGSPINQVEKQVRKLANGTAVLDMELAYTDEQVSKNVEAAKANVSKLNLISKGPIFAGILGLISAAAAAALLLGGRRQDDVVAADGYTDDNTLLDDFSEGRAASRRDLQP